MDTLRSGCDDNGDEEDWMDTSWAQPNSHQEAEESRGCHQAVELRRSYQLNGSNHQLEGSKLGSDKPTLSSVSLTSDGGSKDTAPDDPTIVKRMLLNDNKAGMEGLNKDKINQIIHEASKGSRFYENERKKEEEMKRKIEEQKQKISSISEVQLKQGLIEADHLLEDFEQQRDLSRTIVHIDMDAFYAAVEMRDDLSLRNKPMAVGGTAMLSTSNYHARKFGVRAAMPGFIGKKLCPDLVIVPLNFDKYTTVSKQVKSLIAEYDPNFCPMSLDEAYLDITEHLMTRKELSVEERTFICRKEVSEETDYSSYCFCDLNNIVKQRGESKIKINGGQDESISISEYFSSSEDNLHATVDLNKRPECPLCRRPFPPFCHVTFGFSDEDTVRELRTRIEQRTRLTASAGIAPNMMLSKVCSDKNKPNGQYKIPASREAVMDFIKDLPTRKISGIGKVSEAMLNAVGVYTCTDLYNKRALLYHLYSQISFNYFMRICLGIGSTAVERDSERKSISTERTFQELSKPAELYKKCEELVDSLIEDLKEEQLKGKTVSIKIKTVKFEVKTRAHTLANYTNDRGSILQSALDLLRTEIQGVSPQPLRLRLMGVRMSNLASQSICKDIKKQGTILGAFKKIEEKTKNLCHEVKTECNEVHVQGKSAMSENPLLIETAINKDKDTNIESLEPVNVNIGTQHDSNNEFNRKYFKAASIIENGTSEDKDVAKSKETDLKFDNTKLADDIKPENSLSCDNVSKFNDTNSVKTKEEVGGTKDIVDTGMSENEVGDEIKHIDTGSIIHISKDSQNMIKSERKEQALPDDCKSTTEGIDEVNTIPLNEKEVRRTRSGLIRSNKKSCRKRRNSKPEKLVVYSCPICSKEISCSSLTEFNDHVDDCLNEGTLADNPLTKDSHSEMEHDQINGEKHKIGASEKKETGDRLSVNIDENGNEKKQMENASAKSSTNIVQQVEDQTLENNNLERKGETRKLEQTIENYNLERTGETRKFEQTIENYNLERPGETRKLETNLLDNKNVLEGSVKQGDIDNSFQDEPNDSCTTAYSGKSKTNDENSKHLPDNIDGVKQKSCENNVSNQSKTKEKRGLINDFIKEEVTLEIISGEKYSLSNVQFDSKVGSEYNEANVEGTSVAEAKSIESPSKVTQLSSKLDQIDNKIDEKKFNHEKYELEQKRYCDEMTICKKNDSKTCNVSEISDSSVLKSNISPKPGCSWMSDNISNGVNSDTDDSAGLLVCPVCNVEQRSADLNEFNSHVDSCLSRGAISQILKEQNGTTSTNKRDRDVKKTPNHAPPSKKRKTVLPNKSPSSCRTILSFFKDSQSV